MLKKITLLTIALAAFVCGYSQNCIPDTTITEPGIYPEYIPVAVPDEEFDFDFQILSLQDTAVEFMDLSITAQIDSVMLDSISGLPSGFNYQCEPNLCSFNYMAVGCINLNGNPSMSDTGIYPLTIYTTAFARWNAFKIPTPDTIRDYVLVISTDTSAVGISTISNSKISVYPNPVTGESFSIVSNDIIQNMVLYSLQGEIVFESMHVNKRTLPVNSQAFMPGVYCAVIDTNKGVVVKRIVIY
jgi:hypothetical protein